MRFKTRSFYQRILAELELLDIPDDIDPCSGHIDPSLGEVWFNNQMA
ncbi:hypothetical protein QWY93_09910 [Echinicola jeungdonensis]|uniref:Uncharacterized protein n=1 Tax=Echinicola jeungdonensis TaxID=709343 RepID=A0ABV5J7U4_9BACT|nr:hypothetical protein [Echinicola jeungdonensis]MDN3669639.1 hypothetical protein [Echinicola jeungdonensis]